MAHVIPFTPRNANPGGLLRSTRDRSGLTEAAFAALLGRAVGRPELSAGTIRAWERSTVLPPTAILEAAQRLVRATQPSDVDIHSPSPLPAAVVFRELPTPPVVRADAKAVMQAFRDADRQVGGGYMYGAVVRYLEHEVAPRLFTGKADQFCAAAALTEMAGWMAHDAGDDVRAHQHFERAQRFASATDDCELVAHIHASLSHLFQQLDRPRDGLRMAQAGRAILRRRGHHPALAARLHAMEARALATLRRRADCQRALREAEHALERTHPAPPSTWVSPFDRASLAAEASVCMQQLQELAAARAHCEQVLGLRSNGRSRALGQLRLATILVLQGEIEHACAASREALASSERLSSSRVTQLVQSVHVELTAYATTAASTRSCTRCRPPYPRALTQAYSSLPPGTPDPRTHDRRRQTALRTRP